MTPAADAVVLRRIASRIDAATSVARRSGGIAGTISSYLPGERLLGIRATNDGRIVIHVVMRWGSTVDEVEDDVIAGIGTDWPSGLVDITVDDIDFAEPSPQTTLGDTRRSLLDPGADPEPSPPVHVPTL